MHSLYLLFPSLVYGGGLLLLSCGRGTHPVRVLLTANIPRCFRQKKWNPVLISAPSLSWYPVCSLHVWLRVLLFLLCASPSTSFYIGSLGFEFTNPCFQRFMPRSPIQSHFFTKYWVSACRIKLSSAIKAVTYVCSFFYPPPLVLVLV